MSIRPLVIAMAFLGFCASAAAGVEQKPMKVWNLTAATIVDFRLAPSGTMKFGHNLVLDDKDKEISIDERLTLRDVAPGVYDAHVKFNNGRRCTVVGIKLDAGTIASIEEKDLGSCLR